MFQLLFQQEQLLTLRHQCPQFNLHYNPRIDQLVRQHRNRGDALTNDLLQNLADSQHSTQPTNHATARRKGKPTGQPGAQPCSARTPPVKPQDIHRATPLPNLQVGQLISLLSRQGIQRPPIYKSYDPSRHFANGEN